MSSISLVVAAKNAGATLDRCLASAKGLVSEIVLVDDFSTDNTLEIARKHGARTFQRKLESFGAQKQYALDQAQNDWVFLLDSDEAASPELIESARKQVENGAHAAFKAARKNFYFGQWLRFGGKYPDHQTRLLRRSACRFSSDVVHEKVEVQGPIGALSGDILHYSYPDMKTWEDKLTLFARFRGEQLYAKGLRPSVFNALRFRFYRPTTRFVRRYVFKLGFLDGKAGYLACVHDALTDIRGYDALKKFSEGKP